MVNPKLS